MDIARLLVIVVALTATIACASVIENPNAADPTPPAVGLTVNGIPGESLLDVPPQGASRTVPRATSLDFIATAKDAESGVASITIQGDIKKVCQNVNDASIGQVRTATVLVRQPQSPPSAVLDSRTAQLTVAWDYVNCMADFRPVAMSGELLATATNTAGKTAATGSFNFTFSP